MWLTSQPHTVITVLDDEGGLVVCTVSNYETITQLVTIFGIAFFLPLKVSNMKFKSLEWLTVLFFSVVQISLLYGFSTVLLSACKMKVHS